MYERKRRDYFETSTREVQRGFVAKELGCNMDEPGGWPHQLIDDLVALRLRDGKDAFYERVRTHHARP